MNDTNNKFEILEQNILKDKTITPELLTTLSTSAICASVGLTLNSATLIVGAKLLAPFIRPAQGFGFAIATKNKKLALTFFKQFIIFLVISLIISTIFFKFAPIQENMKQLLNKTTYTYFDILVSAFCGAAGIIGKCRKQSDNILYGVAVAASLMPAVCTMGYSFAYGYLTVLFNAASIFFSHISLISLFAFFGTLIYKK